MSKVNTYGLFFTILFCLLVKNVESYIDPGSQGIIIGSIWSTILSFFSFFGALIMLYFFTPLKKAIRKKKYEKRITFLLITLFIILVTLLFRQIFYEDNMKQKSHEKVIMIGIDGMDPRLTEKLIDMGKMPNLKKIIEGGSFYDLQTSNPAQTPVAWTTISTGVDPGKHNIFEFIRMNKDTKMPLLGLHENIPSISGTKYISLKRADSIWDLTSLSNIPTTVLKYPVTFPPEKINGEMISGLGVPDVKGFETGYTLYTQDEGNIEKKNSNRIVHIPKQNSFETLIYGPKQNKNNIIIDITKVIQIEKHEDDVKLIIDDDIFELEVGKWSSYIQIQFDVGIFKKVDAMFKVNLISINPLNLYMTSMQLNPNNPFFDISYPKSYSKKLAESIGLFHTIGFSEETNGYVEGIFDEVTMYEQLKELEQERTNLFLYEFENFINKKKGLFIHIFESSDRLQHLFWDESQVHPYILEYYEEKDKLFGEVLQKIDDDTLLLIVSDHGFTTFKRAVNLNTWLYNQGYIKLNKEISSNDPMSLFKEVNWDETKAYFAGFTSIYIIDQSIKEKLKKDLINLTDGKNQVILNVYDKDEIYTRDYYEYLPDLIIGFNKGYRADWISPIGGFSPKAIYPNVNLWKADHIVDPSLVPGIFISNKKVSIQNVSLEDIAPTILNYLGVDIPIYMKGRVLLK